MVTSVHFLFLKQDTLGWITKKEEYVMCLMLLVIGERWSILLSIFCPTRQ